MLPPAAKIDPRSLKYRRGKLLTARVRMHNVLGHVSLDMLLRKLAKMPNTKGVVTKKDIEEFRKRKCGVCASTQMVATLFKRSAESCATYVQPKPPIGASWTRDTVALRVPLFQHGDKYITVYTCQASTKWVAVSHTDYTAETIVSCEVRQHFACVCSAASWRDHAYSS